MNKEICCNMPTKKQKKIRLIFVISLLVGCVWLVGDLFGVLPCWIVRGHIVDKENNPIKNASVAARLGIGSESSILTKDDGAFYLMVTLPKWSVSKGGKPSISVSKDGYEDRWVYCKQWSWGIKIKYISIVLAKKSDEL